MTSRGHGGALWILAACGVLLLCIVILRRELAPSAPHREVLAAPADAPLAQVGPVGTELAEPGVDPELFRASVSTKESRDPSLGSVVVRVDLPVGTPTNSVQVILRTGAQDLARTSLGATQEARFDELPQGDYQVRVDCDRRGLQLAPPMLPFEGYWRTSFGLERGTDHVVRLRMERAASLRGTLFDAAGLPVANARVRLEPLGLPFGPEAPSVITDEVGAFVFEGLSPGEHRLLTYWTGMSKARTDAPPPPLDVTLRPGEVGWQDLHADGEPRIIVGRLVDSDGEPLSGVVVDCELVADHDPSRPSGSKGEATPRSAIADWTRRLVRVETDPLGHFRLERLPRVRVIVRASSVGLRQRGFQRAEARYADSVSRVLDLRLEAPLVEFGDWSLEPRASD